VFGIGGGYHMLGQKIYTQSSGGSRDEIPGLGLLPTITENMGMNIRSRSSGTIEGAQGMLGMLNGCRVEGFEFVSGATRIVGRADNFIVKSYDDAFFGAAGKGNDGGKDGDVGGGGSGGGGGNGGGSGGVIDSGYGGINSAVDNMRDGCSIGNVAGFNMHGFFDSAECRKALIDMLCSAKGIPAPHAAFDYAAYRETQYNALAGAIRENIDIGYIYGLLGK
jgi:adenosylcobyric acid synthase